MSSQYIGTDSDAPIQATITLKDAAGNVVAPDDIPVWASSDPTIASVSSTTSDGTGATIAFAGRAGSCTITATSVNKSGDKIVCTGSVVINAGDATQGEIDFPTAAVPATVAPSDPTQPSTSATPPADTTGSTTPAPSSDTGSSAGTTAAPATSDPSSTTTADQSSATAPASGSVATA